MSGAGAISKLIGPKYMQIAKQWMPTASLFGASAGLALLYITEWKLVLQYVPLYNSKFKNEDE